MDYTIQKENILSEDKISNLCKEQPVDLNFSLPDYCPDIQKILKCIVIPSITSKNITSGRLDIDGIINVQFMYLDADKKQVRHFDNISPFSCTIDIGEVDLSSIAFTEIKTEYMNCHATSPRKIDIHGAFSICTTIISRSNKEISSNIEENDIAVKKMSLPISTLTGMSQQQFSINEILEANKSKPMIRSIVKSDINAVINDCKLLNDKAIIKGDVFIKILYDSVNPDNELETIEYTIPISQIIDVLGSSDDDICDVDLDILEDEFRIKSNNSEDENLIEVNLKLCASVLSYRENEIEFITDAYSTDYELNLNKDKVNFNHIEDFVTESYIDKSTIEVEPSMSLAKIIDIWDEGIDLSSKIEDEKLKFSGKINACILSINNEGVPEYTEKPINFEYISNAMVENDSKIDTNVKIVSIGYRIIANNSIEIKTELLFKSKISSSKEVFMVSDIYVDEDSPYSKDEASLIIYFADKGEDIWDIARNYHTTADAIKGENELESDVIEENSMILIPM